MILRAEFGNPTPWTLQDFRGRFLFAVPGNREQSQIQNCIKSSIILVAYAKAVCGITCFSVIIIMCSTKDLMTTCDYFLA